MNRSLCLFCSAFLLLTVALIFGCGRSPQPPAAVGPPTAITLDEWKAIQDVDLKYDGSTIERLRMSDPKLQDDRNWRAFERATILPERTKDLKYAPGQQPP